jgi:hypothetical protein
MVDDPRFAELQRLMQSMPNLANNLASRFGGRRMSAMPPRRMETPVMPPRKVEPPVNPPPRMYAPTEGTGRRRNRDSDPTFDSPFPRKPPVTRPYTDRGDDEDDGFGANAVQPAAMPAAMPMGTPTTDLSAGAGTMPVQGFAMGGAPDSGAYGAYGAMPAYYGPAEANSAYESQLMAKAISMGYVPQQTSLQPANMPAYAGPAEANPAYESQLLAKAASMSPGLSEYLSSQPTGAIGIPDTKPAYAYTPEQTGMNKTLAPGQDKPMVGSAYNPPQPAVYNPPQTSMQPYPANTAVKSAANPTYTGQAPKQASGIGSLPYQPPAGGAKPAMSAFTSPRGTMSPYGAPRGIGALPFGSNLPRPRR